MSIVKWVKSNLEYRLISRELAQGALVAAGFSDNRATVLLDVLHPQEIYAESRKHAENCMEDFFSSPDHASPLLNVWDEFESVDGAIATGSVEERLVKAAIEYGCLHMLKLQDETNKRTNMDYIDKIVLRFIETEPATSSDLQELLFCIGVFGTIEIEKQVRSRLVQCREAHFTTDGRLAIGPGPL